MELFDAIQKRYSVRSYKLDAIEESKRNKVLEAARLAPTAANSHFN
jgi:nitroreductase